MVDQIKTPAPIYPMGVGPSEWEEVARPRPVGFRSPTSSPSLKLVVTAVEFLSDHARLLDNDSDWDDWGTPFAKPEWRATTSDPESRPASHTMGRRVKLEVTVQSSATKPFRATLRGLAGVMNFKEEALFRPGDNKIRVTSNTKLPRKVQRLDLGVLWYVVGGASAAATTYTEHPIYLTMDTPTTVREFPGVTLKRLKHAVERIGKIGSLDPHAIVVDLMGERGQFTLGVNPSNAWVLAEPGEKGDCRTIVRYVINLLKMVGCPGIAKVVLVYEKLRPGVRTERHPHDPAHKVILLTEPSASDFALVAEAPPLTGDSGGLDRPELIHPNGRWKAILFDHRGGQNAFEACMEFTHNGRTKFLPGGVGEAAFDNKEEVMKKAFESLSWAKIDRGADPDDPTDDKMVPVPGVGLIKRY